MSRLLSVRLLDYVGSGRKECGWVMHGTVMFLCNIELTARKLGFTDSAVFIGQLHDWGFHIFSHEMFWFLSRSDVQAPPAPRRSVSATTTVQLLLSAQEAKQVPVLHHAVHAFASIAHCDAIASLFPDSRWEHCV